MDHVRLGRAYRALRVRLRWRQADLAAKSGTSQSVVSRVELGEVAGITVGSLEQIARALGARLIVGVDWQGAEVDRLLDAAHAGLVESVMRRLERQGWIAKPEATFSIYGERGSLDVLARHPGRRAPLVVEVKTAIGDVQELIATHDRKARLAPKMIPSRAGRADRLLVVADLGTARRRIAGHAATFLAAYPVRGRSATRWLAQPPADDREFAALVFLPLTRGTGSTARRRVRAAGIRSRPRSDASSRSPEDARQSTYHPPSG